MSTQELQLIYAVRLIGRSSAVRSPEPAAALEAAFGAVYPILQAAVDEADDWSERLLDAAWDLTRATHGRGTDPEALADTFVATLALIRRADSPPTARRRRKPRRDA